MHLVARVLSSCFALAIAAFCVFGFLASFEPGISSVWKLAYATLFFVFLAVTILPWVFPHRR